MAYGEWRRGGDCGHVVVQLTGVRIGGIDRKNTTAAGCGGGWHGFGS